MLDALVYLMAHAPEAPVWFEPDMDAFEPKPALGKLFKSLDNRLHFASRAAAQAACGNGFYDVAERDMVAWDAEYARQKMIQWPKYWAELQLKQLGRLP